MHFCAAISPYPRRPVVGTRLAATTSGVAMQGRCAMVLPDWPGQQHAACRLPFLALLYLCAVAPPRHALHLLLFCLGWPFGGVVLTWRMIMCTGTQLYIRHAVHTWKEHNLPRMLLQCVLSCNSA
jgi:hypothetical protein